MARPATASLGGIPMTDSGLITSAWKDFASKDGAVEIFTLTPSGTKTAIIFYHADNRVWIAPDLNLDDIRKLDRPYLFMLRELVNTVLYDLERERT